MIIWFIKLMRNLKIWDIVFHSIPGALCGCLEIISVHELSRTGIKNLMYVICIFFCFFIMKKKIMILYNFTALFSHFGKQLGLWHCEIGSKLCRKWLDSRRLWPGKWNPDTSRLSGIQSVRMMNSVHYFHSLQLHLLVGHLCEQDFI